MGESGRGRFLTGVGEWDLAAPGGGFMRGAVHELLYSGGGGKRGLGGGWGGPWLLAAVLARGACGGVAGGKVAGGKVVWSDPLGELFAPAVVGMGVGLERLVVLRARSVGDELWGIVECLRCPGVSVVVASPGGLSRLWARRMQLAAERGGGVGVFMREEGRASVYAAATRWRVKPAGAGEGVGWECQRWGVELVHGIGGAGGVGVPICLEVSRETGDVCAVAGMVGGASVSGARGENWGEKWGEARGVG